MVRHSKFQRVAAKMPDDLDDNATKNSLQSWEKSSMIKLKEKKLSSKM
jgi:hypothetical protein